MKTKRIETSALVDAAVPLTSALSRGERENRHASLDSLVCPPKQDRADGLKNEVGQPNDQMGRPLGMGVEGLAQQNEAVVNRDEAQGDGDADVGLAPMNADSQRDAEQGKAEARERKGNLPMNLDANRGDQIFALLFPLPPGFTQFAAGKTLKGNRQIESVLEVVQFLPELGEGHVAEACLVAFLRRTQIELQGEIARDAGFGFVGGEETG